MFNVQKFHVILRGKTANRFVALFFFDNSEESPGITERHTS